MYDYIKQHENNNTNQSKIKREKERERELMPNALPQNQTGSPFVV